MIYIDFIFHQHIGEELWPDSESDADDEVQPQGQIPPIHAPASLIWQFLFFLFYWQAIYKVSNAAMKCMLKFPKYFILILGKTFQSHLIEEFSKQIPNTTNDAYACTGICCNTFIEYVVCPSCHSVYEYRDCIEIVHGEKQSKICSHIFPPKHPHLSRRKPCGTTLLKKVKSGRRCRLVPGLALLQLVSNGEEE